MRKKMNSEWYKDACDPCDHDPCDQCDQDDIPIKKHKCSMPQEGMEMILAHAYVPWQFYDQAFCPQEALMKGTLFPELWGVYPIPK